MALRLKVLVLAGFVFALCAKNILAVPAAPSPSCEVTAEVLEIKKESRWIERTNDSPRKVSYFVLKARDIKISTDAASSVKQDGFCENTMKAIVERDNGILIVREDTPLSLGQKFKAKVHWDGDEHWQGTFASNIQILDDRK